MGYIYKYLFKNMSRSCWAYTMKLLGNENLFIFYVTSYLQISLQYRTINNDNIIRTSMLHNCSKKGLLRNRYHVYIRFKGKVIYSSSSTISLVYGHLRRSASAASSFLLLSYSASQGSKLLARVLLGSSVPRATSHSTIPSTF